MAKKIALMRILIVTLAAGSVSAHEKGDLVLGIEPQVGFAFPALSLMFSHGLMPGFDFGLRGNIQYYFTDSFSVNAGLGYAGNYHIFMKYGESNIDGYQSNTNPLLYFIPGVGQLILVADYIGAILWSVADALTSTYSNTFFASYFTIPFGVSYAFKSFALSAGLSANIPIGVMGEAIMKTESGQPLGTFTFELKPYLGWYIDIDFPMKRRTDIFGMSLRLNGAFARETVEPIALPGALFSSDGFKDTDPWTFNFFSISLAFKFGIPLANLSTSRK